jgi:hypothetical protein
MTGELRTHMMLWGLVTGRMSLEILIHQLTPLIKVRYLWIHRILPCHQVLVCNQGLTLLHLWIAVSLASSPQIKTSNIARPNTISLEYDGFRSTTVIGSR